MPRFICFVGEAPKVYTTDDGIKVESYRDEEWFIVYDTKMDAWFNGQGPAAVAEELPSLEEDEDEDGDDGRED